ncbi:MULTISPECIES: GntR family transcriptional regulator [Pseudomonas syringae group]|uniref:GntR family transcriptional regulator n=1 Tax=Pseudomonas coronafaciens pv. striafaciens TaxID=235276 RepID=A0A3M4XPG7_9PSED|nr:MULTISPECIES: GntR family transcriptional regulator [Pseudomonas syringae group]MBI6672260.1 GntR family transcriptional regulator [Pseudomonas syringae]NAO51479.1 GntR family transcriptional regulator [Pseudomonas syringae]PBP50306.1 GntR family transcriptional regulator [Pseudomonas syringae]RMN63795.1 GntR family transcriptional regulator [Pseudomonas syringae]RMR78378.1 GntR family transcriptional regulator [Pseudomonas coronafaciens pv. striafaciens]
MTDRPILLPAMRQVSRDTLQDQVYRQIREALMSGRFQPGQKLTIRGLAEALGSSPMPVREALNRLSAENAFEVTETARLRVPMMTPERLREIRDARVALEGLLAEKAVVLINDADLADISQLCGQMQKAADNVDVALYLWTNFAFHRRIYAVAKVELIVAAVENFWLHIGPCFALVAPDRAHLQRSMEAHNRIVEALAARDGAAARAAVTDDIMQAADSLTRLIANSDRSRSRVSGVKKA